MPGCPTNLNMLSTINSKFPRDRGRKARDHCCPYRYRRFSCNLEIFAHVAFTKGSNLRKTGINNLPQSCTCWRWSNNKFVWLPPRRRRDHVRALEASETQRLHMPHKKADCQLLHTFVGIGYRVGSVTTKGKKDSTSLLPVPLPMAVKRLVARRNPLEILGRRRHWTSDCWRHWARGLQEASQREGGPTSKDTGIDDHSFD